MMKQHSSSREKSKNNHKNNSRWTVTKEELVGEQSTPWREMTPTQRAERIACIIFKLALLLFVIFIFICTLGLLAEAFKLIGQAVKNNKFIQNPVSASIIGMVITLVLQSSSTLISILVGMVAGGLITVHQAIPVMMGAEIGASFFNALISLGQSGNRDQFRRAFAAATMNDIFNFLAYLVILPLELSTGVIERVSAVFVGPLSGANGTRFDTLNVLTDPILHKIIQLNETAISEITVNHTSEMIDATDQSLVLKCIQSDGTPTFSCPYSHLFANSSWSDTWIGITLLAVAIILLVVCLIGIVRLLNSLLAGQVAFWVRRIIDKQLPRPFGWLTNYLVMCFGCGVVMIVQSSGVFRSALIPLVGLGVVNLERFYPLILGANVGTTFTGVLAALSADPTRLKETMQIALCQTVYNLLSILFFYPVPFTRKIPITLAMRFGDLTAKYRWFALVYIFFVFFLMPATLLVLSFLPAGLMISICALLAMFLLIIVVVNVLQRKKPTVLPAKLQSWDFLPKHCRSLQPYDRVMSKLLSMLPFFRQQQQYKTEDATNGNNGPDKAPVMIRFTSPHHQQRIHPVQQSTHFPPIRMPSNSVQTDV